VSVPGLAADDRAIGADYLWGAFHPPFTVYGLLTLGCFGLNVFSSVNGIQGSSRYYSIEMKLLKTVKDLLK